jgi:hypothetical protein
VSNPELDASQNEEQRNRLLEKLHWAEQNMAKIATHRRQFDLAEEHCQRCLAYSRRYGLEGKYNISAASCTLEGGQDHKLPPLSCNILQQRSMHLTNCFDAVAIRNKFLML